MRQVFSSPRLENVEAVAELLRARDIEIRISNGRSYRSAIRGNFSYRDQAQSGPQPAVWVVRSEQQPQARRLLRDAGLLQSVRMPSDSYLPDLPGARGVLSTERAGTRGSRLRYGLLAGIAVIAALGLLSLRRPTPAPAPAPAPAATSPATTPATPARRLPLPASAADVAYRVATPPALAEMLFERALADPGTPRATVVCLAIDGVDPAPDVIARLQRQGADVRAASACDAAGTQLALDATGYRTDGSGIGTVELAARHIDAGSDRREAPRRLEVERNGDAWRVLREQ